jgi:hypothetical protein
MSNSVGRTFDLVQRIEHPVQMGGGQLDVEVLALAGARLRGQHPAAVHLLEVAVRELVPRLGVLRLLVVDTEVPPGVLAEPVFGQEIVLLPSRGLVFAPVVALVDYGLAVPNEALGEFERCVVELDGDGCSLGAGTAARIP